jgi:hypothetical protein
VDDPGGRGQRGPVVVVTTMPLSDDARADLSALLGPDYVVVDIKKAPASANIVLTTVVSPRTLGSLRGLFPHARILLTELHDHGRGISYPGPLTRALESAPDGYFFAQGIESLPDIVQSEARLQLAGSTRPTPPVIDTGTAHVTTDPAPHRPAPDQAQDPDPDPGAVLWLEAATDAPAPAGHLLDRRYVDEAVAALLGTSEPRKSSLWAVMVAEAAVHLARERRTTVVVDVTDLPEAPRAQLRLHVGSERLRQSSWPTH